jgi:small multidrug resistance family-3 protein
MLILKTLAIFVLAGICEISGGFLIWLWLREGKPFWFGILGALVMTCYGIVATWQPAGFGRVYATYGGFFIFLSLLWAYQFDNFVPDKYDIIGALVVLIGIGIMYYAPRN